MEGRRYSFTHPDRSIEVDVFVDRLDFCHVVQVGDRLGEHPFALPIETLLLSNLQVIEPTATDLMDTAAILLSHPVLDGRSGPESMPAAAVAGVLTATGGSTTPSPATWTGSPGMPRHWTWTRASGPPWPRRWPHCTPRSTRPRRPSPGGSAAG